MKLLALFSCCLVTICAQKDPQFEDGRNTIVHLFEWKWEDIAAECERFLSPRGFAGVQTSPPMENLVIDGRPWWERYQPVSYNLVSRSGNESAFANMVSRCNAVGVRIYIDAVVNHMTGFDGTGTAGNAADHVTKTYPAVPFQNSDFHETCGINNWNDPVNVRNCELNELRDLDQTRPTVRQAQIDYFNHLISLGVAGFRVDAAKLMWPDDLDFIFSSLNNLNTSHGFREGARAFVYQEVIDFGDEAVKREEYTPFGTILEFQYGAFLGNILKGRGTLSSLDNFESAWNLVDTFDAVIFIDNHDNQRNGDDRIVTYKDSKPYKMAIAFMLAHPYGNTTRIMSSYYFDNADIGPPQEDNGNVISPGINEDNTCTNGWVCEHRWREIFNMVWFKNVVAGTEIDGWWSNGENEIAFSRGNKGFIALTHEGDISRTFQTNLPGGRYCDVISGDIVDGDCTGRRVEVADDGSVVINLGEGDFDGVVAIHVDARY